MPNTAGNLRGTARLGAMGVMAVIAVALAGVLAGFMLSLASASRQFEHAVLAEQQAAAVTAMARQADHLDAAVLVPPIAEYRALIAREAAFLPDRSLRAQRAEIARADHLAALVAQPAERGQVVALLGAIAAGEQVEVAEARAELAHSRRVTVAMAGLLVAVALAAAGLGGWQLLRSNRDLAAQVATRTADLVAVDRSRRLFFAKASHELRTPVTALRTVAEVALAGGGDGRAALGDVVAQAQFLGRRIEDMLALASAEEGRPVLTLAPCDLRDVVAAAQAAAQAYARSIEVVLVVAMPAAPVPICGDARWLKQALLAVIDNGLKFSDPDGALALALEITAGEAVVTIADDGPGILPTELPRVFDAYYQAEAGRVRGGTGLGLALARWVVEQHGGRICAENGAAGGARIVLTLPVVGRLLVGPA